MEDTFHHKLLVAVDLSDNPKVALPPLADKAPYHIPKVEVVVRPLPENPHNKDLEDLSIFHKYESPLNLVDQSLVPRGQL